MDNVPGTADPLAPYKESQKQIWVSFAPIEVNTAPTAARLVKTAGVRPEHRVLDVACGTGVVAITAARLGARVTGLDLTPELLEHARDNAALAGVGVTWHEGDAEQLPFGDSAFDIVLSQFGHMFAPRPEVTVTEMLRVLAPGGTIAFSTWPPETFVGRFMALIARYLPAPPPGVAPPPLWGEPNIVRERLGAAVKNLVFDRATMLVPALSPQHYRAFNERTLVKVVQSLKAADPARLATFREEIDDLVAAYFEDNLVRQDYLLARATKI